MLNNDVLLHFEQQGLRIETVLSDNGREFYRMKKSRFTNSQIIDVSKRVEQVRAMPGPRLQLGHALQVAFQVRWHGRIADGALKGDM